jgi:predicted Zn-dependent protease
LFFFVYFSGAFCVNIIRESEAKAMMKELAQPLFSASGIDDNRVNGFIINVSSINAFLIDNNGIFRYVSHRPQTDI